MNKLLAGTAGGVLALAVVHGIYAEQVNRRNEARLQDQAAQLEQLLSQVQTNTQNRLDYERQLDDLRRELLQTKNQAQGLDVQLSEARAQSNPDYSAMEQRLRREISADFERRSAIESGPISAATLVSQLGTLDMQERMAVLGVQAQYGEFLDQLNVDQRRKDVIVEALVNVTLDQNQARMDLAAQSLEPRELRQRMAEISSPEAVRESLAYALTEDELAALESHQQSMPNIMIGAAGAGPGNVFMMRSERRDGQALIPGTAAPDASATFNVIPGGGGLILRQRIEQAPN